MFGEKFTPRITVNNSALKHGHEFLDVGQFLPNILKRNFCLVIQGKLLDMEY